MKEYITTIIYICIFSIILELILPSNKLKKYIQVLVSLIIIISLISPVIDIFNNQNVVSTISTAIESLSGKTNWNEYDFSNIQSKYIFGNVKESLEQEIYSECNKKFGETFNITSVNIDINDRYNIQSVKVYVSNVSEVARLSQIISHITETYKIDKSLIEIIKEG